MGALMNGAWGETKSNPLRMLAQAHKRLTMSPTGHSQCMCSTQRAQKLVLQCQGLWSMILSMACKALNLAMALLWHARQARIAAL